MRTSSISSLLLFVNSPVRGASYRSIRGVSSSLAMSKFATSSRAREGFDCKDKTRTALVQFHVGDDKEANLLECKKRVEDAVKDEKVGMVLLPEVWNSPYGKIFGRGGGEVEESTRQGGGGGIHRRNAGRLLLQCAAF